MTAELAQLNAKVDMLMSMVRELKTEREPERPMTIKEFSRRVGLSRWTIQKRIRSGMIITKGGKVPPCELRKFGL